MHLYFLTRGIKHQRDLFVDYMTTQMFKWTRKNLKTGKDEIVQVQGALRPIELWEYIFPEEDIDEVLTMLHLNVESCPDISIRTKKNNYGISEAKLFALRKMIGKGIKPIPKRKPVVTNKFIEQRGIALYPIGIKKDLKIEKEAWGYEQELL